MPVIWAKVSETTRAALAADRLIPIVTDTVRIQDAGVIAHIGRDVHRFPAAGRNDNSSDGEIVKDAKQRIHVQMNSNLRRVHAYLRIWALFQSLRMKGGAAS